MLSLAVNHMKGSAASREYNYLIYSPTLDDTGKQQK